MNQLLFWESFLMDLNLANFGLLLFVAKSTVRTYNLAQN